MISPSDSDNKQTTRRSKKHFWTGLFFGTLGIVVVVVAVLFFVLLGVATESQESSTALKAPKEAIYPDEYCSQHYPLPRYTTANNECHIDVLLRPNIRYKIRPEFDIYGNRTPTPTPPSSNI